MNVWNREEIEQLQLERLQSTLNRVYRNVAFYKKRFDRLEDHFPMKFSPIQDLAQIPPHGQRGPAAELSLRDVRPSSEGGGPYPFFLRGYGEAHGDRLYQE